MRHRSGLEAVLMPPIRHPTALAWVPGREELLVGTRTGEVVSIDPVLGTRPVVDGLPEVAVLAVHGDRKRFFAMACDGTWVRGTLVGQVEARGQHPFRTGLSAFFAGEHAVVMGEDANGRRAVRILRGDRWVANLGLPPNAIAAQVADGSLVFCRSGHAGLEVLPLKDVKLGASFAAFPGTEHRLRAFGSRVVGVTSTGVACWSLEGGPAMTMRLPDVTVAAVSADGAHLSLGTRNGAVALARMADLDKRIRPDLVRAYQEPVRAVAFSDTGRWLATGAEGLRIWSWDLRDGGEPPEPTPVPA